MVKRAQILREYRDAGALHALLPFWGFVDDSAFLTKAGDVGLVYRLRGVEVDGISHAMRRAIVHRVEAVFRLLDERCRVYQYLVKRSVEPFATAHCDRPVANEAVQRRAEYLNSRRHSLYELGAYVVLLYETPRGIQTGTHLFTAWPRPLAALRTRLSARHTRTLLETTLDGAIATLYEQARVIEAQLGDVGLRRLDKTHAFRFFRQLLNGDASTAATPTLPTDAHLDYFVADAPVDCHRDHLRVGQRFVKVLSMKAPPTRTFAGLLDGLSSIPGDLVACLEWQRLPNDHVRRDLQTRRRHFFNKRVSIVNYVSPETKPEEMLVDESAGATVRQLGDALTEIEVNGHVFGQCSLTLVLYADDHRTACHQAAEAKKVLAVHDGSFFDETYNLLNAWLAVVPGATARNLRRLALLETNVADLSFLFIPDHGDPVSPHLGREALAFFETPHHTPYAFNLHVQDVGHTVLLGATGAGKSFLLNFLITHAQKYEPMTVVLDLGQSYRKLATLLEGQYLEVGLTKCDVTINPFALAPTPEHLHFLHAFVRVLLEGQDAYRLSDLEDRELYEAIENLYVLDASQRRLLTLANLLPRTLANRLHKWVEGGRYGTLFDNEHDTLTFDRLQVFDFEAMREYPALLEPLLFYILHRVTERIQDPAESGTLKLCVLDEAWRFIQHPALRAYVQEGLKTWRKRNGAMLLATHTLDDFASADLLRTVVESCPTKLLLANPGFDRAGYGELLRLNERELDLLAGLIPRQQLLLKRPDLTKVLTLTVDPKSYWIYTNTPIENERVAAIFREHGFEAGLALLAASA